MCFSIIGHWDLVIGISSQCPLCLCGSSNWSVDVPAGVEDVFGVELFFYSFEQDRRIGAAAPDEVGREAGECGADDFDAAAEPGGPAAKAADECGRDVGLGELCEASDDDAAGGVGLNRGGGVEVEELGDCVRDGGGGDNELHYDR